MRGLDILNARGRAPARGSLQAVVGELETIVLGDAGSGGAPSLPLEQDQDYGPTPAQLKQVAEGRAAREAAKKGPVFTKPGAPAPPPAEGSFLVRPLWKGAPVRVWQAGLGGLGVLLLMTGVVAAVRR